MYLKCKSVVLFMQYQQHFAWDGSSNWYEKDCLPFTKPVCCVRVQISVLENQGIGEDGKEIKGLSL
jgi:hypothetical protein